MTGNPESTHLAAKIARLAQERGWNQEDFARQAHLSRQTVRQILVEQGGRRLRNATVSACAQALHLSVHELRDLPLAELLARNVTGIKEVPVAVDISLRRHYEEATQPELLEWMDRNPGRAKTLSEQDFEELLSLQGTGGPLTTFGVEHFVDLIERKRRLLQQVNAIAGTEYLEVLEKLVALMYDKIRPYASRS